MKSSNIFTILALTTSKCISKFLEFKILPVECIFIWNRCKKCFELNDHQVTKNLNFLKTRSGKLYCWKMVIDITLRYQRLSFEGQMDVNDTRNAKTKCLKFCSDYLVLPHRNKPKISSKSHRNEILKQLHHISFKCSEREWVRTNPGQAWTSLNMVYQAWRCFIKLEHTLSSQKKFFKLEHALSRLNMRNQAWTCFIRLE